MRYFKNSLKESEKSKFNNKRNKILNIVWIVLGVSLVPILIINCCLIINSIIHKDEVPSIGNFFSLIVLTEEMEPNVEYGDLIICKKVLFDSIEVGDVISFYNQMGDINTIITDKVETIETDSITGDIYYQIENIDDYFVSENNVIGIYTGTKLSLIGKIILFVSSPSGVLTFTLLLVLLWGVIMYIIVFDKRKLIINV